MIDPVRDREEIEKYTDERFVAYMEQLTNELVEKRQARHDKEEEEKEEGEAELDREKILLVAVGMLVPQVDALLAHIAFLTLAYEALLLHRIDYKSLPPYRPIDAIFKGRLPAHVGFDLVRRWAIELQNDIVVAMNRKNIRPVVSP
jgi:hypothetical protein